MQSLFSSEAAEGIVDRIGQLAPDSQAQWGKMNVVQMLAHCSSSMEVVRDQKHLKRLFMGYVLGGLFKKQFYNDQPFRHNSPTHPYFVHENVGEFHSEKDRLINHIRAFQTGGPDKCTRQQHAFFGRLTPEQWAIGMYKHADHHLRQFGV